MPRETLIDKAHRESVSATMAATICGVNPWDSPYALYERIVGDAPPREQTFPMWLGIQMEGVVLRAFTRETKLRVARPKRKLDPDFHIINEEYGFPMSCLLDGITEDSTGKAVVEAKTGHAFALADWEDDVPLHYWFQNQHQLAVTGWRHCYVPAIIGNQFKLHLVERDDEIITLVTDKEREFWNDHVLRRVPPPIDGHKATGEALQRKYRHAEPGMAVVLDDPEIERLVEAYQGAGEAIDRLKSDRDEIKFRLIDFIKEAEIAEVGSYRLTLKEQKGREGIDLAALRADHPDIYEQYKKTGAPMRPLRISKTKGV